MKKLSAYTALFIFLSIVLLALAGCNNDKNASGEQSDEQTAADYVKSLGYTIITAKGETERYTLEAERLKTLEIKGMEYSEWLGHWKERYGAGGEAITLTELKSLSEKGASLNWSDFDKYAFEDIGSGIYIRKYKVEGERQLLVSGRSLEDPPDKISIVDSSGNELELTPENVEGL